MITSFSTILYTYIPKITFSCSESNVKWTCSSDLPKGLSLDRNTGVLSGQVIELVESISLNITATNSDGSTSILFPFIVTDCPYGKFLFPHVESSDQGMFILSDGIEEVYKAYLSTTGIKNAICIPYKQYDYSFHCMTATNTYCNVVLVDNDSTVYLALHVLKNHSKIGTFNMVITDIPTPIPESNPFYVVSDVSSLLFFTASAPHGNFTFTPSLPTGIEFNFYRSSLKGTWHEPGIYIFTIQCSNEKGIGSTVFSVAVDRCSESLHLAQLSRKQGQLDEELNITNSHNELIYQHQFDNNVLKVNLCLPEDEYTIHMSKQATTGWSTKSPLIITDESGFSIGEYTLEAGNSLKQALFTLLYPIPFKSSFRYTKQPVSSKWMEKKFKDSTWNEGTSGNWGNFDVSTVYFRKTFSLSTSHSYARILLDLQCNDKITIYLNEKVVIEHQSINNTSFHFSLPSQSIIQGENLLACSIERTQSQVSSPLLFDLQLQPLSSSCLSYTLKGDATDDLLIPDPSHPASLAFDDNPLTYWTGTSLPATLTYIFSSNHYEIINKVGFFKPSDTNNLPLSFRIEGITENNQKEVLTEIHSSTLFQGTGIAFIQFSNKKAYHQYNFVFLSSSSGKKVFVNEIYLYSCNELTCKKKWGIPATSTGSIYYKSCPFGSVGQRQMKCIDSMNKPVWIDDRSSCLPKIPPKGIAYVDTSFILYNVTYSSWLTTVQKGIVDIILLNLVVKANETAFTLVRDLTNDSLCQIYFALRFTLEEDIGDYVQRHTKYLINDFNTILTKKYGSLFKGISIQVQEGPSLHEPIPWTTIIVTTVSILIIFVLFGVIYLRSSRGKRSKKSLLSHRSVYKDEGKNSLLSNE